VTYTVGLVQAQANGGNGSSWTALQQNVSLSALQATCLPSAFFGVVLSRATSLRNASQMGGANYTRMLTSYYQDGVPFDLPLAQSGDYDGFSFVSAGEAWDPPSKADPTSGYTFSVPIVDEYLAPTSAPPSEASSSPSSPVSHSLLPGAAPPPVILSSVSDVYFYTGFYFSYAPSQTAFSWAFNGSDANKGVLAARPVESRTFWTVLAEDGDGSLDTRMDKLAATALAEFPPSPAWVRDIALTSYDYFTPLPPSPYGWDADVDALAAAIGAAKGNPGAVAMCVHGWYGTLGDYTLSSLNDTKLEDSWVVFPSGAGYENPTAKIPLGPINVTTQTVLDRIQKAKTAGFRVILYFADGLNTCTGVPYFNQQSLLSTYHGYEWVGPDSEGTMKILNPLDPRTRQQYHNYMQGLLDTYGQFIDGFVWDETFELPFYQGGVADIAPGYAQRGMMELVRDLTAQVHAHPNCAGRCVFTVAGCTYNSPHALVADGTYEDTGLNPAAAAVGVLPNWRGPLWECGWADITKGYDHGNETEAVYVTYNVPVGLGNGWGDFVGFGSMTTAQQDYFVSLFMQHEPGKGSRFPPSWEEEKTETSRDQRGRKTAQKARGA
jgi:hypothetical protein